MIDLWTEVEYSYWNGTGKYQKLYEAVQKLIPVEGAVRGANNTCLEKLRKAINCYYDLYNNGLCNRAAQFAKVFGFSGKRIVARGLPYLKTLEDEMDLLILAAANEQGVKLPDAWASSDGRWVLAKDKDGRPDADQFCLPIFFGKEVQADSEPN